MKKSRFTDSQIMAILYQYQTAVCVADLGRERGCSTAMIYQWRSKYGGIDASLMKGIKAEIRNVALEGKL